MESIINQFVNSLPFELHLVDPIVGKYSACGPGTKHKERIKKFLETKDVTNLYKNDLDKACSCMTQVTVSSKMLRVGDLTMKSSSRILRK